MRGLVARAGRRGVVVTKVTTLNGLAERFPDNAGPDIVVRVDLGESIQYAIDVATDRNGDGYIIVGAVNSGIGAPYGTTASASSSIESTPCPSASSVAA